MKKLIIGTRGSELALTQTSMVKAELLQIHPDLQIEIRPIKTSGDIFKDAVLADIGGKELFTKEIDQQLFDGTIDIAIHSLKDVPGIISPAQQIIATLPRGDARDALIGVKSIDDLPHGAVVGSASPRRKAQLLHIRPDLDVINFRGNVQTRIKKVGDKQVACTLLAMAGMDRLNLNIERHPLTTSEMLPCAGQGTISIAARSDDHATIKLVSAISHQETFIAATAERAVLATYNGNCQTPIAAYALIKNNELILDALIASTDGRQIFRASVQGKTSDAEKIGTKMGEKLLENSRGFA